MLIGAHLDERLYREVLVPPTLVLIKRVYRHEGASAFIDLSPRYGMSVSSPFRSACTSALSPVVPSTLRSILIEPCLSSTALPFASTRLSTNLLRSSSVTTAYLIKPSSVVST